MGPENETPELLFTENETNFMVRFENCSLLAVLFTSLITRAEQFLVLLHHILIIQDGT